MLNIEAREGNVSILCDFYERGSNLLFYGDEHAEDKYRAFSSFIECGLKNNALCCYVYPNELEEIKIRHALGKHAEHVKLFPITDSSDKIPDENICLLKETVAEMCDSAETHNGLRMLFDFGKILNDNFETIMKLEEWTHEYNSSLICTMSAFNTNQLNLEVAEELIKIHKRVTFLPDMKTSIYFSSSINDELNFSESINVTSKENIEEWIKKSLDILVLVLLNQKPMCGFDIIKTIVHNFGVLLSQGTVYPLLHSLKDLGYVETKIRSDNKAKGYVLTEAGSKFMESRIKDYIHIQRSLITFVTRALPAL